MVPFMLCFPLVAALIDLTTFPCLPTSFDHFTAHLTILPHITMHSYITMDPHMSVFLVLSLKYLDEEEHLLFHSRNFYFPCSTPDINPHLLA